LCRNTILCAIVLHSNNGSGEGIELRSAAIVLTLDNGRIKAPELSVMEVVVPQGITGTETPIALCPNNFRASSVYALDTILLPLF
jgi:hypothetical protein